MMDDDDRRRRKERKINDSFRLRYSIDDEDECVVYRNNEDDSKVTIDSSD